MTQFVFCLHIFYCSFQDLLPFVWIASVLHISGLGVIKTSCLCFSLYSTCIFTVWMDWYVSSWYLYQNIFHDVWLIINISVSQYLVYTAIAPIEPISLSATYIGLLHSNLSNYKLIPNPENCSTLPMSPWFAREPWALQRVQKAALWAGLEKYPGSGFVL